MARARRPVPTFAAKSELYRYVDCDGGRRRRASQADFLPNPGDHHLSVQSLEIEARAEICRFYSAAFNGGEFPVGICVHQVQRYSELGRKSGVDVKFNRVGAWEFIENGRATPAYRHRPVLPKPDFPFSCPSHCGVEFVRGFDALQSRKFARRMAVIGKVQHVTLSRAAT
jgi:hypothetical protein